MAIKMKAKFNSKCAECGEKIREGDDIVYNPDDRKAYCPSCGEDLD